MKVEKSQSLLVKISLVWLLGSFWSCAPVFEGRGPGWQQAEQYVAYGTLEMERGQLDQAERWFELALEIERVPTALDGLGCLAFRRADTVQARRYFEAAYELDDGYFQALANLAQVEEAEGHTQRAAELYSQVLHASPAHVAARNNLAVLMLEEGELTPVELRAELNKASLINQEPVVLKNMQRAEDLWEK